MAQNLLHGLSYCGICVILLFCLLLAMALLVVLVEAVQIAVWWTVLIFDTVKEAILAAWEAVLAYFRQDPPNPPGVAS